MSLSDLPNDIVWLIASYTDTQSYCRMLTLNKHIRERIKRHNLEIIKFKQYITKLDRQMKFVSQNGNAIQYIENPSFAVQLAAAKQNGQTISHLLKIQ